MSSHPMFSVSRSALVALTCLALPACGAEPADRFAQVAAAARADLAKSTATAASIAVWLDGKIVYVGGFGHKDPDAAAPPDADTQFLIGSDAKKLTAITALQAVAAGKAKLDDSLAKLLPELHMADAPDFSAATLRQLLAQTSGIMDGGENTTSTTDGALASFAYGTFAQTFASLVPPGAFFNYSNPNYSLAGLVAERLAGRPWADVVEQGVFAPLGMTRSVARRSEVDANHAKGHGHTLTDKTTVRTIPLAETWESAFVRPAGLVWSTPSDQARLAAFLVDGNPAVLPAALHAELSRPQAAYYPDTPVSYGMGLVVGRGFAYGDAYYDVPVWTHGGNTPSHTSTFYVLPDQRFAVSILSNGDGDDFTATAMAAMATLAELPAPSARPARPFDPSQLDRLTGSYVEPRALGEVLVARSGDALTWTIPTLDAAGVAYDRTLTAATTRVWFATIDGAPTELTFIDGPDGSMYLRSRNAVAWRAPAP